jgi:RimJ/RimL family protein N-acetyltransferase
VIRLIEPADAADAYALLTDERLEHLDPEFVPESEQDFALFAKQIQARAFNGADARRYQWAVRLDTGALVGLVTADLHVRTDPPGARAAELTAFIHPDHQQHGHFTASARRLLRLLRSQFGITHQEALIRGDNLVAQAIARRCGLAKEPGQDPDGYETWVAEVPPRHDR